MGGLEDEDDEDEPEWLDFNPEDKKKEKKDFFGRSIPDE
jgi:hypothetical protein